MISEYLNRPDCCANPSASWSISDSWRILGPISGCLVNP
jgi:hypothetical protein